jgi:hypothetical protein
MLIVAYTNAAYVHRQLQILTDTLLAMRAKTQL